MPYAKTSELPDAVQKLPEKKQRQFMAAFNSAHKSGKDETSAFKIAWGAIKESADGRSAASGFRDLSEDYDLAEAMGGTEIDDANGIIKNVVLLTGNKKSANNTFYTDEALAEAKDRYEGANMFLDHGVKGQNRSVRDFGGVYKNLRLDGNKLRGDVALRESARKDLTDIAKMRPAGLGLSIKDRGRGYDKD
jgi:cation transport regulator ChaB